MQNLIIIEITISGGCNVECGNGTDTCYQGVCQCGNNPGLVCSTDTGFPLCSDGQCVCTKTLGKFEPGDGSTRGSCLSVTDKCHLDGSCDECLFDSHCYGLSDSCKSGKCKCGDDPPCNSIKSNICTGGICYCGTEAGGCHIEDQFYSNLTDPRNNTVPGLQRSKDEICEKVTEYYNPNFIPNHPLMVNGTHPNGTTIYAFDYDDQKGKHTGTYQCLGS